MLRGSMSRAVSLRNPSEVCLVVVGYREASASLLFLRLTSSLYFEEDTDGIIGRSGFVSPSRLFRVGIGCSTVKLWAGFMAFRV